MKPLTAYRLSINVVNGATFEAWSYIDIPSSIPPGFVLFVFRHRRATFVMPMPLN